MQTGQYSSFSKISSDSDIFPVGRLLYTCWTQNRPQNMKTCMILLANKMALLAPFYPLGEDYQFHFTLTTIIAPSCAAILLTLRETCYAYTCMRTTPIHTMQAPKHQRQYWRKKVITAFLHNGLLQCPHSEWKYGPPQRYWIHCQGIWICLQPIFFHLLSFYIAQII